MKKEIIIFIISYIISILYRAFTGISYNPIFDKFNLLLFIKDIMIWTVIYIGVKLLINKFTKNTV